MTRQAIVILSYLGLLGCFIYGGVKLINHSVAIQEEDKHFRYLVEEPPEPALVPDAPTGDLTRDIQSIQGKIASMTLPSPGFISRKIGVAKGGYNIYLVRFPASSSHPDAAQHKAIAVTRSELAVGAESRFIAYEAILLTKAEPYRFAPDRLFSGRNPVGDYDRLNVCVDAGNNPLTNHLTALERKKVADDLDREKARRRAEEAEIAAREERARLEKSAEEFNRSKENAAKLEAERLMQLACKIKATVDVCADELPIVIKGLTKENVSRSFADEMVTYREYAMFISDGMKELPETASGDIMRSDSHKRYIEIMTAVDELSQASLRKKKKWDDFIASLPAKQAEEDRQRKSIRETAEKGRLLLEQKRQERSAYYLSQSRTPPPASFGLPRQ